MRNSFILLKGAADGCLFVEDSVTAQYLNSVFSCDQALTRRIRIYTAGGWRGVRQLVNNFPNLPAYGWIDRDFRPDQCSQWRANPSRVYQSSFLEIENCFLDGELLSQAYLRGDEQEIESALHQEAEKQPAWLACRATLAELHEEMQAGFIGAPSISDALSETQAREFLLAYPWRNSIRKLRDDQLSSDSLNQRFDSHYAVYCSGLETGEWRHSFSGKEIFKAVVGHRLMSDRDTSDVVKRIGELQVQKDELPCDITRLIAVLNHAGENHSA